MRLLEPRDYGLIALAMVVIGFVGLFSELGLGAGLVQIENINTRLARTAAGVIMTLNLVLAALIAAAAPSIASWFNEPGLALVIQVLALDLVVSSFAAVPFALLERQLRFQRIAIVLFSSTVAGSLTTITMAWLGFGVWSLVCGTLATSLVRALLIISFHGGLIWPMRSLDLSPIRPLVRFSGFLLGSRFLWYWFGQADQMILGRLLNGAALGHYNVASQLAMLPVTKMMEAVNRVSFPILSRLRTDSAALKATYQRLLGMLAAYGIAVCWGLAAVSADFVALVLGSKWSSSVEVLALLALVAPMRALASFQNTVTTSVGAPEASTKELLFASVSVPGAVLLGALSNGVLGAALAWVVTYPFVYGLSCVLTARALQLSVGAALRPLAVPALSGAAMIAVVVTTRASLVDSVGLPLQLLLQIAAGALAYMVCLYLFWRVQLRDSLALLRELLRPQRSAV